MCGLFWQDLSGSNHTINACIALIVIIQQSNFFSCCTAYHAFNPSKLLKKHFVCSGISPRDVEVQKYRQVKLVMKMITLIVSSST
jgi:hypothetical protein